MRARVLFLLAALPLGAQRPPRIGYVHPAGGRQGTTLQVEVGGDRIYDSRAVRVAGSGVKARILEARDPEAAQRGDQVPKARKANQTVLDEKVRLEIQIEADAEPGERELCLVAPGGLTNKLRFQVDRLREVAEQEPNDKSATAPFLPDLPVVLNGRILPGDIDHVRFRARKGERLVFEASARALVPYLADAVPGWFQALLVLMDGQGRELARAGHDGFRQDPVLCFEVPADGAYVLAVRDALWRGREDFTYRVRCGALPHVEGLFPLGARRGPEPAVVALRGWNLPATTERVPMQEAPDRRPLGMGSWCFAASDLPEVLATPGKELALRLPVVVNGAVAAAGRPERFRFEGRKGQAVVLEVEARRLGSPLDARLVLRGPDGAVVAQADDTPDPAEGFQTHAADPVLSAVLPADGAYTVQLSDVQGRAALAYRLRVSAPRPDVALRVGPASLALRPGGSAVLWVQALRRDGFQGPIPLALEGAPGLTLEGGLIPEGRDRVRVTLSAAPEADPGPRAPRLVGRPAGLPPRAAEPCEDQMEAFANRHLVTWRETTVEVEAQPAPYAVRVRAEAPVPLQAGRETALEVEVRRAPGFDGPIRLALVDPPRGLTLRKAFLPKGADRASFVIRAEADCEAGLEHLVLQGTMPLEREATPEERARLEKQAAERAAKTGAPLEPPKLVMTDRHSVTLPALTVQITKGRPHDR